MVEFIQVKTAQASPFIRMVCVLAACAAVLITRLEGLRDDRVWADETYVVLGANGVSPRASLPPLFSHQHFLEPSLTRTLKQLATEDAYPPLVYVTAFISARLGDPILNTRRVFVGITLICGLVMLRSTRSLDAPHTLLVTVLALCSIGLVQTGTDVKWASIAPAVATLCGLSLLAALETQARWLWGAYVILAGLCLHTHYFMLSLLPAHALFVAISHAKQLKTWIRYALVVILLCAPWYVWGFPQQQEYVNSFFAELNASGADSAWKRPLTAGTWAIWLGYNLLAALGFQPSGFRSAYLGPVALLLMAPIFRSLVLATAPVRALTLLASLPLIVAWVGQSLYAARLGHTTPLSWSYFVPWYPLLIFGLGQAAATGGRWSRAALYGLFAWTVGLAFLSERESLGYADSMNHRSEIATDAAKWDSTVPLLVHRNDWEAKLFNLYYKGTLPQTICARECTSERLAKFSSIRVISASRLDQVKLEEGWQRTGGYLTGRSRVDVYERLPYAR